jgi:hypothetical protein
VYETGIELSNVQLSQLPTLSQVAKDFLRDSGEAAFAQRYGTYFVLANLNMATFTAMTSIVNTSKCQDCFEKVCYIYACQLKGWTWIRPYNH